MCSGEIQAVSLIEIERQMLFYFLQPSRSWRWRCQRQARLVLPWKCFCGSNARWHSLHEMRKLHFCRSLSPWVLITLLLSNVLCLPWNLSTPALFALITWPSHLGLSMSPPRAATSRSIVLRTWHVQVLEIYAQGGCDGNSSGYDDILYVCVWILRIKVALLFPFWPLDLVVAFHTLHLRLGIVILMKL